MTRKESVKIKSARHDRKVNARKQNSSPHGMTRKESVKIKSALV